MDTMTVIVSVLMILTILIAVLFNRASQSKDDFKDKITEELESKGFQLVDILIPKLFETGPFPIFRLRLVNTRLMGVSGERTKYRKIKYKDRNGIIKMSWIRITTTAFVINNIKWIPEI